MLMYQNENTLVTSSTDSF